MKDIGQRVKDMIESYTDHMNVEIQQRACEFLQIFDQEWDEEEKIFDPIPFKGDENMLVDATGRAIIDEEEGDLLVSRDEEKQQKAKNAEKKKKMKKEEEQEEKNIIDLDEMLDSGSTPTPQNNNGQPDGGGNNLLDNLMNIFDAPVQENQVMGNQMNNQMNNQIGSGLLLDDIFGSSTQYQQPPPNAMGN
mmetsp:Transcript_12698/g.12537  ORF Transcript_12698/g.12537 Transcript_12698/m.12537 type:complete len:191 (+) Transcript_12698:1632-2204(+)